MATSKIIEGVVGMKAKTDEQPHDDYPRCGAKNRAGMPCQQKAGWGTDHVGYGRCKLHGGKNSGAPKGNQNAFKHGMRSQFHVEQRKHIMGLLREYQNYMKSV